ncbi:MAG: aldo/keto reductase [Candidatus Lokiarchaeota archaeon]|nr:aldo/keto reductase [Candidatus Lokiarchaeota archaeon]
METRLFGKTKAKITIIAMGGCGLGYVDQIEADKAVKLAMDHGINMIDVAPTYGKAEERLKPWIQKYRDKFFLAEKTMKRTKKGAWRQLNQSLERLNTTYFDLYQFHAVSSMEELDQILGKDGAMEAFKEAKEIGLIKYIGITAHDDVRILQRALTLSDDFDTVLLPVYVASLVNPNPVNDFKKILQIARDKNIGVTAIKAISKNRWKGDSTYNTWYEPLDKQELVNQAVWFTLSQDGVTTYSLPCDVRLWPLVLNAVKLYKKLNNEEIEKIINMARENEFQPLFPE